MCHWKQISLRDYFCQHGLQWFSKGSVRSSCLYFSVGEKNCISSAQSLWHFSVVPISAWGHIGGCTFRIELLNKLLLSAISIWQKGSWEKGFLFPDHSDGPTSTRVFCSWVDRCCLCNKALLVYKGWKEKQTKTRKKKKKKLTPPSSHEVQQLKGKIKKCTEEQWQDFILNEHFFSGTLKGCEKIQYKHFISLSYLSLINSVISFAEILETKKKKRKK